MLPSGPKWEFPVSRSLNKAYPVLGCFFAVSIIASIAIKPGTVCRDYDQRSLLFSKLIIQNVNRIYPAW